MLSCDGDCDDVTSELGDSDEDSVGALLVLAESLGVWDTLPDAPWLCDSVIDIVSDGDIVPLGEPLAEDDGACVDDAEGVNVSLDVAVDEAVAVGEGDWLEEVDWLGVPVKLDEPLKLAVADSVAESDLVMLGLKLGDGDDEEVRVPVMLAVSVRLGLPIAEGVGVIDSVCVGVEPLLDEPVDVGVSVRVIDAVSVRLGVTVGVCVRLGVAVGVWDGVCVKLGVKLWDVVCAPASSSPLKKGQRVANGAGPQLDTPVPNAPIEDTAVVS